MLLAQKCLDTINGRCAYVPTLTGACFAIHFPNAGDTRGPRDDSRSPRKTLKPSAHCRSSSDPRDSHSHPIHNVPPRERVLLPEDPNTSDVEFFRQLSPRIHVNTAKILVVDDAQSVRTLFKALFKRQGIEYVDLAENGQDGYTKLIETDYDVVFMDFLMPIMNGIDCVKTYRTWEQTNRQRKAVIIGMSANAIDADLQSVEVYMQGFLQKPASFGLVTKFVQFHDYLREDTRLRVVVPESFLTGENAATNQVPAKIISTDKQTFFFLVAVFVVFVSFQFYHIFL